jgi:hypothetical protein
MSSAVVIVQFCESEGVERDLTLSANCNRTAKAESVRLRLIEGLRFSQARSLGLRLNNQYASH